MAPGAAAATALIRGANGEIGLALSLGRGLLFFASASVLASPALAQTASAPAPGPVAASALPPLAQSAIAAAQPATVTSPAPPPLAPQPSTMAAEAQTPPLTAAPTIVSTNGFSLADLTALESAVAAAKRADAASAQAAMLQMTDPAARKAALWALIDADGEQLGFSTLDQARADLSGWPRASRREEVAEKALDSSGLSPSAVIAWFNGADPTTPQGAMALASAYQLCGRTTDAQALIKHWWDDKPFDADAQRAMLARFGDFLTPDDHARRASTLLYAASAPGLGDILALLPPDQLALAQARMALRDEASDANELVAALPPNLARDPGLAVDSARYLMSRDLDDVALELAPSFPSSLPNADAASRVWALRRQMIASALRAGDYQAAYEAATNTGLTTGADAAEAEFYAGWIALSKLRDPAAAETHFAAVQAASTSPITQARALYWRGRAAEARGDEAAARMLYAEGARYLTTFYGQLAAGKAGIKQISLGHDPVPTAAQRAAFDARDTVRAARMLEAIGEKELFRAFMLCMAEEVTSTEDYAMLVDLATLSGDQDLAMRVVRLGAQHGYVLPDRGYPVRDVPASPEAAEAAMVFGITRQESGFDPSVRSPVGARGMMQLMPHTAEIVARQIGEPYGAGMLDDADYNMRLGASYLGHMIDNFGGSYVLAAAAYNAGPGRPQEWMSYCGDPRAAGTDPADFIECIPFSETRNYVMRVLEAAEVYRARLNGGSAPLNLEADLKRGGYVYSTPSPVMPVSAPVGAADTPGQIASATPPTNIAAGGASVIDASTPLRVAPGVSVQGSVP